MTASLPGSVAKSSYKKKKSPLSLRLHVQTESSSLDFLPAVKDADGFDSHWCFFNHVDVTHVFVRFETLTQSEEYFYVFLSCFGELGGWRLVRFVDFELCSVNQ